MPRNPTTGVFTRVNNSFSDPVQGTIIEETDAIALWDDYDDGLNDIPLNVLAPATISVVTTAGPFAVSATLSILAINKGAPSATSVTLPTVASRGGLELLIFDWGGNAGDITITPNGSEKINNAANHVIGSGGSLVLTPSTDLSGWLAR